MKLNFLNYFFNISKLLVTSKFILFQHFASMTVKIENSVLSPLVKYFPQ